MMPRAERRTAHKYSNVIGRERLHPIATRPLTCPSDRERPLCREFASKGSGFKPPSSTKNRESGPWSPGPL